MADTTGSGVGRSARDSDADRGVQRVGRAGRAAPPRGRAAPIQPSLRRLREFAIRPDRELGQNFLVDSNILDVIGGLAALAPADVVLEIGGGLGVLSEYLAARAAHVHVVEIDQRLRPALEDAVGGAANVTLHWGDALRVELAALRPAPGKVVANLPYGVAASALLRTIEELPGVGLWVAMVQREVGERLAAAPGGRVYGAPSVLAQLACEVRVARAVPRTVFRPVPNVDSVLVVLTRRASTPAVAPALRALVADAFAHRRKTLVRSLALATRAYDGDAVHAALAQLGHPPDARAERLAPQDFRALAELLALA
ncbi:MAG TPA: 16S rRNA (adenine(1518)-N(6)/adenine(1519)-N(6))-dimethyltransferase RsmA [Solirubrobacteraceae bacterium]|nr:16S rRNA (adenine(1518)-N(6)/adenine(1519)-N(6))-dimethyltransferase RsmA [Solirubrobacteraceae bacterium]